MAVKHSITRLAKIATALLAFPLLMSCTNVSQAPASDAQRAGAPALIPFPAHLTMQSGQFTIADQTPLIFDKADADSARIAGYFADLVHRKPGIRLVSQAGGTGGGLAPPPGGPQPRRRGGNRPGTAPPRAPPSPPPPPPPRPGTIPLRVRPRP